MIVKLFLYSLFLVGLIIGIYFLRKYLLKDENGDVFQGMGHDEVSHSSESREVIFKTDFLCEGCVARLTPHINNLKGVESCRVELQHPDKLLHVKGKRFSEEELVQLLKKHGYIATKVSSHPQ